MVEWIGSTGWADLVKFVIFFQNFLEWMTMMMMMVVVVVVRSTSCCCWGGVSYLLSTMYIKIKVLEEERKRVEKIAT